MILAACAPTVQRAMEPPSDFSGPRFDLAAQRFYSFDGAPLGLSAWAPEEEPWAVIVGVHGMNDYGEHFYLAGPAWAKLGIATYAYDSRGHGRSPRRGLWGGERLLVADLRAAVDAARARHPDAIVAVVGHSMGGATAIAAFASASPPKADRLVLVAPAVWGWSRMPPAYAVVLWTGAHMFPSMAVSPPRGLQRKILASDNIPMLRKISSDPLMIFETRTDAVYGLVDLMDDAYKGIGKMHAPPTLYLQGEKDQLIPKSAAVAAARRADPSVRTALYDRGYHMLLSDLQADTVWADIETFLRDPAAPLPSKAPPLTER